MDPILGIHESALIFRSQRMDVLATNLANADTPNFKARDMEFADIMSGVGRDVTVRRTHARHIDVGTGALPADLKYRNPHQPAMDGNTVEADLELSRYAENAVGYRPAPSEDGRARAAHRHGDGRGLWSACGGLGLGRVVATRDERGAQRPICD
jgi:flagellar basal-body rod protein FlgB